jgi:hypothetical protein
MNATITGNYIPRTTLTGQFSSSLGAQTFSAVYDASYETPASLAAIAGSYSAPFATPSGFEMATFSVSSSGIISGAIEGCSFTGQVTPHGKVNAFDLSVKFLGGVCLLGTSTLSGIAYYDAATQMVYAAAFNTARTAAFAVVAGK